MLEDLHDKVVCITGAAGGIGSAIARAFANQGARLALLDQNGEGLARLKEEIAQTLASVAVADLSTEQGVKSGIAQALGPFGGRVDILVANVGKLQSFTGPFEELSSEQWEQGFAINLFSHVYACQAVIPQMKRLGRGRIIFIGSDQGLQPDVELGIYGGAKAAVHHLAKTLARELAPAGILTSAIAPGMTRTPLVMDLIEQRASKWETDIARAEIMELQNRGVPLARLGEPDEIAETAVWMARVAFSNGSIVQISGGNVRTVVS